VTRILRRATAVASITTSDSEHRLYLVSIVTDWGPGPGMRNTHRVPSVISYWPPSNDWEQQQFGYSLSPNAEIISRTKNELEIQETKCAELDLILKFLDGADNLSFEHIRAATIGYPYSTSKRPEHVVADYLSKIFPHVYRTLALQDRTPTDIAVTVPEVR
jgi:hypothetical protein